MKRTKTNSNTSQISSDVGANIVCSTTTQEDFVSFLQKLKDNTEMIHYTSGLPEATLSTTATGESALVGLKGLRWFKKKKTLEEEGSVSVSDSSSSEDQLHVARKLEEEKNALGSNSAINEILGLSNGEGVATFLTLGDLVQSNTPLPPLSSRDTTPVVVGHPKPMTTTSVFEPKLRKKVVELAQEMGPGFRVICKQVSSKKSRTYAAVWMPDFLNRLLLDPQSSGKDRTFNELISDDVFCRLYLDIDILLELSNPSETPPPTEQKLQARWKSALSGMRLVLDEFCVRLCWHLSKLFNFSQINCTTECFNTETNTYEHTENCAKNSTIKWCTLDSSDYNKLSKHIVFTICKDNVLFRNKRHIAYFLRHCVNIWEKELDSIDAASMVTTKSEGPPLKKQKITDNVTSVVTTSASTPVPPVATAAVDVNSGGKTWKYLSQPKWSKRDIVRVLFRTLDYSVYAGDSEFRMYESTKWGEKRPLILETISELKLSDPVLVIPKVVSQFYSHPTLKQCMKKSQHCQFVAGGKRLRTNLTLDTEGLHPQGLTLGHHMGPFHQDVDLLLDEDVQIDCEDDPEELNPFGGDKGYVDITPSGKIVTSTITNERQSMSTPPRNSCVIKDWNLTPFKSVFLDDLDTNKISANEHQQPGQGGTKTFAEIFYATLVIPFYEVPPPVPVLKLLWFIDKQEELKRSRESLIFARSKILNKMVQKLTGCLTVGDVADQQQQLLWTISDNRQSNSMLLNYPSTSSYYDIDPYGWGTKTLQSPEEEARRADVTQHQISFEQLGGCLNDLKISDYTMDDVKELLRQMAEIGDDPLGKNLCVDIAKSIASDTGMDLEGYPLIYKDEFSFGDGLHFIKFDTHFNYKKCYLRGRRCGRHDDVHGSNNTYFLVRLNDFTYYQKCHSKECQAFYATTMAKVNPKTEAEAFNNAMKNARGVEKKLNVSLWRRIQNFLTLNNILNVWEQREEELQRSAVVKKEEAT